MGVLINWRSLLCTCKNGKQRRHYKWAAEIQKTFEEEERGILKKSFGFFIYLSLIFMLAFSSTTLLTY